MVVDGGSDGSGAGDGAATSTGDDGVLCGTMTCSASNPAQSICCIDYPAGGGAPAFSCVAAASACQDNSGGTAVPATCAGSADCTNNPGNPVCCGMADANGNYSNSCQSTCSGFQMCQSSSECPAGTQCTPLLGTGPTSCQ